MHILLEFAVVNDFLTKDGGEVDPLLECRVVLLYYWETSLLEELLEDENEASFHL